MNMGVAPSVLRKANTSPLCLRRVVHSSVRGLALHRFARALRVGTKRAFLQMFTFYKKDAEGDALYFF